MRNSIQALAEGRAPEEAGLLDRVTAGVGSLTDFLTKQYLEEFIARGGSKLKFVTGRKGAGKTHLSNVLLARARERGFVTVRFSAGNIWLHDFREIYLEILRQCGLETILKHCADSIIRETRSCTGWIPAQNLSGRCCSSSRSSYSIRFRVMPSRRSFLER